MDYIAAVGALALQAGCYKDGIVRLVEAVNLIPDEEVLGIIRQLRFQESSSLHKLHILSYLHRQAANGGKCNQGG